MTQNKSKHEQLGITFAELGALYGTREMLKAKIMAPDRQAERPPDAHLFNMDVTCMRSGECGTVSCIGGTMALIMGMGDEADSYVRHTRSKDFPEGHAPALSILFYPIAGDPLNITPEQAVQAIDNFLATGQPQWREVTGQ